MSSDYYTATVDTTLERDEIYELVRAALPALQWRRGESEAQGALTVTGLAELGGSVRFWLDDDVIGQVSVELSLRSATADGDGGTGWQDRLVRTLRDEVLPQLGTVVDWRPAPADRVGGGLASLPVHRRAGDGPYFENEVADRWPENWWGMWGFALQRLSMPVERSAVEAFRDDTAPAELRSAVTSYLLAGPSAVAAQEPAKPCDWCDEMVHKSAYRWDGEWLWPEDLAHLVERHGFVVPNRFVDRIRSLGSPPQQLEVDPAALPFPEPSP